MLRLRPSSILLSSDEVAKALSSPTPAATLPIPTPSWDAAILSRRSRLKSKFPATNLLPPPPPTLASTTNPTPPHDLESPRPSRPIPIPRPGSPRSSSSYNNAPAPSSLVLDIPIRPDPTSEFGDLDGPSSPRDWRDEREDEFLHNVYEEHIFRGFSFTREPSEAEYMADGEMSLVDTASDFDFPPLPDENRLPPATAVVHGELDGADETEEEGEDDDGASETEPDPDPDPEQRAGPMRRLSILRQAAIRNWSAAMGTEEDGVVERRRGGEQQEQGVRRGRLSVWTRRTVERAEESEESEDSLSGVPLPPEVAEEMEARQRALQIEAARRTIR